MWERIFHGVLRGRLICIFRSIFYFYFLRNVYFLWKSAWFVFFEAYFPKKKNVWSKNGQVKIIFCFLKNKKYKRSLIFIYLFSSRSVLIIVDGNRSRPFPFSDPDAEVVATAVSIHKEGRQFTGGCCHSPSPSPPSFAFKFIFFPSLSRSLPFPINRKTKMSSSEERKTRSGWAIDDFNFLEKVNHLCFDVFSPVLVLPFDSPLRLESRRFLLVSCCRSLIKCD